MPSVQVIFYKEANGEVPFVEWVSNLSERAQAKCRVRVERLEELGCEIRRPEADYLRDGIYELRIGLEGVNYRILYFYFGSKAVVLSHGIVKESFVPPKEIDRAVKNKANFEENPELHTFIERGMVT